MTELTAACLTHRRVPLTLLAALPRGESLGDALTRLARICGAHGVVALSTCNRFEVYLDSDRPIDDALLAAAIAEVGGVDGPAVAGRLDVRRGDAAARHLFAVAAGLDSRVVGEGEILGQVRAAADASTGRGLLTGDLPALFQWAVRAGRRARRRAGFRAGRSTAQHAVRVVLERLGGLSGRRVLVVGAGQIAGRAVRELTAAGATAVVATRGTTAARTRMPDVTVVPLALLPLVLPVVDAVVCATSASTAVVSAAALADAVARRDGRALFVVDLSVPRNVDPAAEGVEGVTVVDLDALAAYGDDDTVDDVAVERAHAVVDAEVAAYREWCRGREIGRLIETVTARAERIRIEELDRVRRRGDEAACALVDEATRRIVNKLLHGVVTGLRRQAAVGDDDVARALADLLAGPVATSRSVGLAS